MDFVEIWEEAIDSPDKAEEWGIKLINHLNQEYIQDIKDGKILFITLPVRIKDFEDEEEMKEDFRKMEEELQLENYEVIDMRKLIFVYIRKKEVV
jgi:TRAP-type C4-dicarboxylate transport system substrate-binding protein